MTPAKKTPAEGEAAPLVVTLEEAISVAAGSPSVEEPVVSTKEEEIRELHAIVPDELALDDDDTVAINGVMCRVSRLRFREHLALGRIITRSAQFVDWGAFGFGGGEATSDSFISVLVSLASNVPMAENELIGLFRKIVFPVDEMDKDELNAFYLYTNNPDLLEVIEVARIVIKQEKDNWKSIVKTLETIVPLELAKVARETAKKAGAN
jgi:hypothetical protein